MADAVLPGPEGEGVMKTWPIVGAAGAGVPEEVEPFGEHLDHRLCVLFLSHVFHQGKPAIHVHPNQPTFSTIG